MSATVPESAQVLTDVDGPVLVITLNRPAARNAVNATVSAAVGDALARLAEDPALHVGILTGTSGTFCAGADLKEVAAGRSIYDPDHPDRGFAGIVRHVVDKPVIAAVNGPAFGGGTEIVLACDLAIAADTATFALPEVKRGLIAAAGGLLRLYRQIPQKLAAQAILTGDPIDAATALRWGLVNAVVPAADVLAEARALAHRIAANSPHAVGVSKRVMRHAAEFGSDWDAPIWAMNEAAMQTVRGSHDALEGARAFAAKRAPVWEG